MKIVINALQYKRNSSGIGIMLRDLFGTYTKVTARPCEIILPKDGPVFPAAFTAKMFQAPCSYEQGLRRMLFQTFQLGLRHCEDAVLLTTDSKVPLLLPKRCVVATVVTDLAVYRLKETYQLSRMLWWRIQYRYIRRRANLFFAISEFTKRELMKLLNIPSEKIMVVPCACSPQMRPVTDARTLADLRGRYGLPERFVLFVGNFNPRKNLERLIQAFDLAKERGIIHHLVIAGEQGWKFDREAVLNGIIHRKDVRFLGYVPDEDMPALYSAAELFAFPTLYEGFGIPVLEAQACGTPVLTSNCSALPEVGGDGAFYVDPYDVESISNGIQAILTDSGLSQRLVQQGLQNAKRFSWERSAQCLNEIIERNVGP